MSQEIVPNITDALDPDITLECEPLPYDSGDVQSEAHAKLIENQHALNRNIASIMDVMNKTMATVDGIASEVQPMVESISKHPMLRMLGGGK